MESEKKCVMIINEDLPIGIIANTAAIMGITLGKTIPYVVGEDVYDMNGSKHAGIIEFPVPILKGKADIIKTIRQKIQQLACDVILIDFSDLAQICKTYHEYIEKMKITPEADLKYCGIALYGTKSEVTKLTGNLPLLGRK